MESIHGHEVLNMMIESGEQYSNASLEAAITARFGEQARFHTCSAADMTAGELVAFLAAKGKFIAKRRRLLYARKQDLPSLILMGNDGGLPSLPQNINSAYQA